MFANLYLIFVNLSDYRYLQATRTTRTFPFLFMKRIRLIYVNATDFAHHSYVQLSIPLIRINIPFRHRMYKIVIKKMLEEWLLMLVDICPLADNPNQVIIPSDVVSMREIAKRSPWVGNSQNSPWKIRHPRIPRRRSRLLLFDSNLGDIFLIRRKRDRSILRSCSASRKRAIVSHGC